MAVGVLRRAGDVVGRIAVASAAAAAAPGASVVVAVAAASFGDTHVALTPTTGLKIDDVISNRLVSPLWFSPRLALRICDFESSHSVGVEGGKVEDFHLPQAWVDFPAVFARLCVKLGELRQPLDVGAHGGPLTINGGCLQLQTQEELKIVGFRSSTGL